MSQDLCCRAYCTLRNHANHFINLFAMMLSTGIPELQCADDIDYLREVLKVSFCCSFLFGFICQLPFAS